MTLRPGWSPFTQNAPPRPVGPNPVPSPPPEPPKPLRPPVAPGRGHKIRPPVPLSGVGPSSRGDSISLQVALALSVILDTYPDITAFCRAVRFERQTVDLMLRPKSRGGMRFSTLEQLSRRLGWTISIHDAAGNEIAHY